MAVGWEDIVPEIVKQAGLLPRPVLKFQKGEDMKEKILLVDDDPDILDALTMILETKGYKVVTAHDGIEGLANLKAENPDLLILDREENPIRIAEKAPLPVFVTHIE